MEEKEHLQKLEERLEAMGLQLKNQYAELQRLRHELQSLKGMPVTAEETPSTTSSAPTLENLIGLRFIHLIGIVVLVIGLSLGVKYAIDKNLISEGLRIVLAYAAGLTLYGLSARLKKAYAGFSAILFSGGVASLYFTTFGACIYYGFISYPVSFIIMVALTVYTVFEALRYNRQEIALLGLVGAYGIPFLISPNRGHTEMLFLYISIINGGVVYGCAKKPWPTVGRAAQAISWLLFLGWAGWQADPSAKVFGPVFLAVFFLLFAVNALSPKLFRNEPVGEAGNYQYLFNLAASYVAALLVYNGSFSNVSIALVSFFFAAFAAAQALALGYWKEARLSRLLAYSALIFFTLFIGFWWNGINVTLLWLLTAVAVFAAGVKLKSVPARMAAITLMGATLLKLVALDSLRFSTLQKVIAYLVLGVLLLLVSFFYQKFKETLFANKE